MKLSVIIPVFNEAETINEIVERVRKVPLEKEILLVDDSSTDGSGEILAKLSSDPDLKLLPLDSLRLPFLRPSSQPSSYPL